MTLTALLLTITALWIAANLSVLAFVWRGYRLAEAEGRSRSGRGYFEAVERDFTEYLIQRLREDIERYGPDWFEKHRKTKRG